MYRLIVLFTLFSFSSISQKFVPFTGKLVYSIQITDTSLRKLIPTKTMVVYTNDTLLRIENDTDKLGKQVVIKHLILKKSYLLIRTPIANYAIQADHNTQKRDTFPYSFKKKFGKTTICGLKANRLKVSNINFPKKLEFLYLKNTSPKYLNTFENFPGIPVHYFLATEDGIYEYTLVQIDKNVPKKDLFGIPSDFKKVTFDEFMDELMQFQMEQQNPTEKHE